METIINNQQDYWNEVSRYKEFTTLLDTSLFSGLIDYNSFIVDYGCGYGRTLNELYLKGYNNLLGFDFASEMISRGKKEFPYLNLQLSNGNIIDCPSNSVDLILLFAVITCIIDDNEQKQLIEEIKRVLKPGAYIYINDFLINTDERNKLRYNKYKDKYGKYGVFELAEGAILRHHSKDWIFELTSSFEKVHYKENTFKTMNGHVSNGLSYIGKKK